jgi:hypothetical protein
MRSSLRVNFTNILGAIQIQRQTLGGCGVGRHHVIKTQLLLFTLVFKLLEAKKGFKKQFLFYYLTV